MPNHEGHTHGNAPAHTHENAFPGHSHDTEATTPQHGFGTAAGTGTAAGAGAVTAAATDAEHDHPGVGRHTHADARPGHTHDYDERTTVTDRPGGGLAARLILGLIGAAGMIIGPFLAWAPNVAGTEIQFRAFFSTRPTGEAGFAASVGFTVLILGVIALVGLAFKSGWLTSLAAGLGLLACILIVVTVYRSPGEAGIGDLQIGFWISAIGSLLALFASMFGAGRRATAVRSRPAERL
jgi:hypothetical protein